MVAAILATEENAPEVATSKLEIIMAREDGIVVLIDEFFHEGGGCMERVGHHRLGG